ncbi:MAG: elongation factor 1-beta [Thaumarchaeota archaeon]|nr:elongation factor 1-beta [Nitrososphaerota archaeon]
MTALLIRLKILPKETTTSLDAMATSIESILPEGVAMKTKTTEPIAFGLESLILDLAAEERDGITDEVESAITSADNVGSVEMTGVSRMSATLRS